MKKIAYVLIAASLGLSSSAFAAGTALPSTGVVTTGTGGLCELLSEQIKVNLSANVSGAFNCDVPTNTITVGTCHNAGSRNPSVTCTQIGTDEDDAPIYNVDSCTAETVGDVVEAAGPDYRGFFGQTSGGSVGAAFLAGTCSAAKIAAHPKMGN